MRAVPRQGDDELPPEILALDPEIRAAYHFMRLLPDGRIVGVHRLMFHWTLHYGLDWAGYEGRYCYMTFEGAVAAAEAWDGTGDPGGWHKHPPTKRRRDPETGETWHESEDMQRRLRLGRFAPRAEAPPEERPGRMGSGA